jgi:hypothetical protein
MHRSTLQPIRTRRVPLSGASSPTASRSGKSKPATPGTRQTIAAIGALWLAFAGAKHSA